MDNDRHQDSHEGERYRRVEVITGRRRRRTWSSAEKAAIGAESFVPGANVSEVARASRAAVIPLRSELRVLVATQPVDFRAGMDRLATLVETVLKENPFVGDVFVFRSKRRAMMSVTSARSSF